MAEMVELHCAYQWDCPSCGRENFVRAVTVEFTTDDRDEMIEHHGGDDDDWQTGNWLTRPEEVICSFCKTEFQVDEGAD